MPPKPQDPNSWPQPLKDWVTSCFAQMTDANRTEAQNELKQVISNAYSSNSIWNIDWSKQQLQSLLQSSPPKANLKRKLQDSTTPNKKLVNNKKAGMSASTSVSSYNDQEQLAKRAKRFEREAEIERQRVAAKLNAPVIKASVTPSASFQSWSKQNKFRNIDDDGDSTMYDPNVIDWDRHTIVGKSQELFKHYLRLTSAFADIPPAHAQLSKDPDPKDIRPLPVLQQTLAELKLRWRKENNYPWTCDQFKSLRQDLTVQRIKNEFTVQVYEIHARMALESSDLVEYNQCQATLRQLYELGIPGKNDEFMAYRILYMLHGRNRAEINILVGQLTDEQKSSIPIRHALDVQTAMSASNYHAFFALFLKAPNMGGYIMDHFLDRERVKALLIISKAYTNGLVLSFIASELAFDSATELHEFLLKHSSAFYVNPNAPDKEKVFDCKTASQVLVAEYQAKYSRVGIKGSI